MKHYRYPKILTCAAICAALGASHLHGQTIINGTETATSPGGLGSAWDFTNQSIVIGSSATGELFVPADTEVLVESMDLGSSQSTASGYLEIDGAGAIVSSSTDVNANSAFAIGLDGSGEILVTNGGLLSTRSTWLGFRPDSEGKITVTGPDSRWESPGGWSWRIGEQGMGTLELLDGATVGNQASLFVGNVSIENPIGSGTIVGGGTGVVSIEGGSTFSGTGSARIGNRPGTHGTVTVTGEGSTFSRGTWLHVGSGGDGVLNITEGGSVITGSDGDTNSALSIGGGDDRAGDENSTGEVLISGPGSLLDVGSFLYVGRFANGTLLAENGGTVRSATHFRVAHGEASVSEATFTGEGTLLEIGDYSYVGGSGVGTMHVLDGARIENPNNTLSIARFAVGEGVLNISGGGVFQSGGNAYVGREGLGTLNIAAGGSLLGDLDLRLGYADTAQGHVIVSGQDAEITLGGDLRMATGAGDDPAANTATASLLIAAGGAVSAAGDGWIRNASTISLQGGTLSVGGRLHLMDTAALMGEGLVDATVKIGSGAAVQPSGAGLTISSIASGALDGVTLNGIDASAADGAITLSNVTMAADPGIDIVINALVEDPLISFDGNTDLSGGHVTISFHPVDPSTSITFPLFDDTGAGEPDYTFASVNTPSGWELQEGVLLYTGVIAETAFEEWASGHGLTGDDAALDAIPAGDGFTNLAKFAFGGNPTVPTPALVDASQDGSNLVLRWNQLTDGGADYAVENSATLASGSWAAVPGATPAVMAVSDVTPPTGYERVEWSVDAAAAGDRSFYRVNADVEASLLP